MPDLRTPTKCDACGQTDDHPKWHYGAETYHHDCVPDRVIRDVTTEGYWFTHYDTTDLGNGTRLIRERLEWIDGPPVADDDMPEPIKKALKYRKLAMDGTRGDRLRSKIVADHEES